MPINGKFFFAVKQVKDRNNNKNSVSKKFTKKILTFTTQPHQKNKIFRILNMFAIMSILQKKFNFCQNPQK